MKAKFLRALPAVLSSAKCRTGFIFLTLTVRNCDVRELRSTIKEMNKGWNRMNTYLKRFCPWFLGWVLSTEVTRGKDGTAHPHFHILLLVKEDYFGRGYLKHSDWMALWKRCAKLEYDPSVHVQSVKAKPGKTLESSFIAETLKYSTKVDDDLVNDSDWLCTYAMQIRGLKFVRTGGLFAGIMKDDYSDEELLQGEGEEELLELPEEKLSFRWLLDFLKYGRKKTPKQE